MKVLGAFLADEAYDLSAGGLSMVQAGIARRVIPTAMESFLTNLIVLCETRDDDIGKVHTIRADLVGPDGEHIAQYTAEVATPEPTVLLRTPLTFWTSPEREGRHILRVQLGDQAPVTAAFELRYST